MLRTSGSVGIALWAATAAAAFTLGRVTAPAQEPPPPDDLAGAILAALGEGDALERLGRSASLLEGLEPGDLPDVVAVYERMIPSIDPWDLAAFFSAWARFDPAGALDYALAWPRRTMLEERRVGVRAALAGWAYADPSKARGAAEEVAKQHAPLRGDVWAGLVAGWARSDRDLEGLGAFLAGLRPRHQRDAAAEVAARELVRAGGAHVALDWADAILGGESQDPLFKRAIFESSLRAAVASDPARAGAWALEHAESDYAVDGPVIAARWWGRVDGPAVMTWLGAYPAGERREKGVREAFVAWSTADWESAQAWLESTSLTALLDPALEVWSEQLLAWGPAEALGWCERILDAARRQRCLASGASRWYAKDALAAEAWLQTSSLDEEARSQVRKATGQPGSGPQRQRRPRAGRGPT
jgi:hypothetical protein